MKSKIDWLLLFFYYFCNQRWSQLKCRSIFIISFGYLNSIQCRKIRGKSFLFLLYPCKKLWPKYYKLWSLNSFELERSNFKLTRTQVRPPKLNSKPIRTPSKSPKFKPVWSETGLIHAQIKIGKTKLSKPLEPRFVYQNLTTNSPKTHELGSMQHYGGLGRLTTKIIIEAFPVIIDNWTET